MAKAVAEATAEALIGKAGAEAKAEAWQEAFRELQLQGPRPQEAPPQKGWPPLPSFWTVAV